jgi:RecJ-like exonuclease
MKNERNASRDSHQNGTQNRRSLKDLSSGDYFEGTVKILRVAKPGPLILNIYDGTKIMEAVIRDSVLAEMRSKRLPKGNEITLGNITVRNPTAGNLIIKDSSKKQREQEKKPAAENSAPPQSHTLKETDLKVGKIIELRAECQTRGDQLQLEVEWVGDSTYDFDRVLADRSRPSRESFSILSDRYEKMREKFYAVAARIRLAILQSQPILLRHHNDADGICAGLAVEQACRQVIDECGLSPEHTLYRSPSVSPFYDPIDVFRDINMFQRYSTQFGDPAPLIVLLDTGSTPENLFCFKVLQAFHYECIVVDHHNPGALTDNQSAVCPFLALHLNPYLFGLDNQTSGGMLGYELARWISPIFNRPILPAVAGIADRCTIPEVDALIANSTRTRDQLTAIGVAIDYLAFHFKFDAGDGVYERIFEDENLVQIIYANVQTSVESQLESMMPSLKSRDINGVVYSEIDLERYTQRFKYPPPGKILGMIHDTLVAGKGTQPVITVGYFSDGVIIRATHPIVPVPTLLEQLQHDIPEANVEGGGHETAGSLKFIPAHCQAILQYIQNKLKENSQQQDE